MTPERHRRLCAALDRRQPDLSVILEGVHKPHNINAIVRTCDAVGVLDVHAVLPENRARASASSAMGSQRWVYVHEHDSGPDAVAAVDQHVIIPMMGMVSSFNVSVAAAIILSEACEQRRAAGLYQQRRLSEARYQHAFFRWAHPRLAAYCERSGVPYPALADEGRIAEPRRFDFLLSEAVRRGEDA